MSGQSDEEKILRRGYSFTEGFEAERGQLDAGLFFISFRRDPHRQFGPLQQRLAANDRLNEYIRHTSSALFACPPGPSKDAYIGEHLFTSPPPPPTTRRGGFQTRPRTPVPPRRDDGPTQSPTTPPPSGRPGNPAAATP